MESRLTAGHHEGHDRDTEHGQQIVDEVTSWPDVTAVIGSRGELSLRVGRKEIGHLHGDRIAHFGFPKAVGAELGRRAGSGASGLPGQGRVGRAADRERTMCAT